MNLVTRLSALSRLCPMCARVMDLTTTPDTNTTHSFIAIHKVRFCVGNLCSPDKKLNCFCPEIFDRAKFFYVGKRSLYINSVEQQYCTTLTISTSYTTLKKKGFSIKLYKLHKLSFNLHGFLCCSSSSNIHKTVFINQCFRLLGLAKCVLYL